MRERSDGGRDGPIGDALSGVDYSFDEEWLSLPRRPRRRAKSRPQSRNNQSDGRESDTWYCNPRQPLLPQGIDDGAGLVAIRAASALDAVGSMGWLFSGRRGLVDPMMTGIDWPSLLQNGRIT